VENDQRDLDPRRLLVFAEVARRGSLAAAAQHLGWTQPAVAQHVKRLERDAGCALLVRTSRGVTLTEAGRALAEHATAITARLRAAREDLTALAELRAGRVRLAAFPSACATFVPAALSRLQAVAPGLDVRLTEAEPPQARRLLDDGDVDLAVTFAYPDVPEDPAATSAVDRAVLFEDELLLVLPAGSALGHRGQMTLGDAASEPWIAGCPRCRAHLLAAAAAAGFLPDIRHSTDDYVVTQTLVAAGVGVALVPALALEAADVPGVKAVPPQGSPPRTITLDRPADLPAGPSVRAVIDALLAVTAARRPAGA
jgi:DNA-binding transcriptional LysR family regulator